MTKHLVNLLFVLFAFSFITSCSNSDRAIKNSNTAGVMKMSVDATLYPLIHQAVNVFEGSYPKAVIYGKYVPGQKAINNLMTDSAMVAITSRELTKQEMQQFMTVYKYKPVTSLVAIDAVALIVNNANHDTLLSANEVKNIFSGKMKQWQQLTEDSANVKGSINIVFDNPYSSTVRAIKKFADIPALNLPNAAAVDSNKQVIQYVSKHPDALGVIGVNWISQKDENRTQKFLSKIHVIAIAPAKQSGSTVKYYKPLAKNLKPGLYPIIRGVYVINRGSRISLGTGFSTFLNGPRGQLLIEMSGLVPVRPTPMIIHLKNEF
jgi:phosphate transport system substrate-binding protein